MRVLARVRERHRSLFCEICVILGHLWPNRKFISVFCDGFLASFSVEVAVEAWKTTASRWPNCRGLSECVRYLTGGQRRSCHRASGPKNAVRANSSIFFQLVAVCSCFSDSSTYGQALAATIKSPCAANSQTRKSIAIVKRSCTTRSACYMLDVGLLVVDFFTFVCICTILNN